MLRHNFFASFVLSTLLLGIMNGCATVDTGLVPQVDFRSIPSGQMLALVANAGSIVVNTSGPGVDRGNSQWIPSCNGEDNGDKAEYSCFRAAGDSAAGYDISLHRRLSSITGTETPVPLDPEVVRFAMAALLRGCGVWALSEESAKGDTCDALGGLLWAIGNTPAALAIWEQAPGCKSYDRGSPVNLCVASAIRFAKLYSGEPQRLLLMAKRSCGEIHDRESCEYVTASGAAVDMKAVDNAENTREATNADYRADSAAKMATWKAEGVATREALLNAVGSLAGSSDPNAIVNSVKPLTAPVRANVGANAAHTSRIVSAQLLPVQQNAAPTTLVPAPSAADTGSTLTNSPPAPAAAMYLTPLAVACVRQYWDSNVYNWLSFENDCGKPIYLTFIFHKSVGWAMTGSMDLSSGAHQNTGRSSSDINQANGFDLYVCPANSIPVDLNGKLFTTNVSEYRCKPQ